MFDCTPVRFGPIPFIGIPGIMRKEFVQTLHVFIAVRFRQYAGRCNGRIQAVALNNAFMGCPTIFFETIPIYEEKFWAFPEFVECKMHGLERSFQDINSVDFFMIHGCHRIAQRMMLDIFSQLITVLFSNLFRIIQQRVIKIWWKNYRCSKHWSGQAPTASFVASSFDNTRFKIEFKQRVKFCQM